MQRLTLAQVRRTLSIRVIYSFSVKQRETSTWKSKSAKVESVRSTCASRWPRQAALAYVAKLEPKRTHTFLRAAQIAQFAIPCAIRVLRSIACNYPTDYYCTRCDRVFFTLCVTRANFRLAILLFFVVKVCFCVIENYARSFAFVPLIQFAVFRFERKLSRVMIGILFREADVFAIQRERLISLFSIIF